MKNESSLPCRINERLYILTDESSTGIDETICKQIIISAHPNGGKDIKIIAPCMLKNHVGSVYELYDYAFGKIVFLNYDEAVAAKIKEN